MRPAKLLQTSQRRFATVLVAAAALAAVLVGASQVGVGDDGLAFIGPDSDKALRTAIAAGRQNHLWDVVHGLYVHQGAENAGWVGDGLVTEIADEVSGLDDAELLDARWESTVETELKQAAAAAEAAGVKGTPAFQLGPTGGRLEHVQLRSLGPEGIVPAIDAVLAR